MRKKSNEYEFTHASINTGGELPLVKVRKVEILKHFNEKKPQLVSMSKDYHNTTEKEQNEIDNILKKIYDTNREFILECHDEETDESGSFKCFLDEKPCEGKGTISAALIEKL